MIRALRRGVTVRVILANRNCAAPAAKQLRRAIRSHAGSFVRCISGSARSAGGTMHQKSYTFSAVGSVKHITIVGSANATVEGYADQWVDMFQHVNRPDVYAAYNDVFALQQADANLPRPYRQFTFDTGHAQFNPVNDPTPTAADDPVHRRLTALPKGQGTVIRVASFGIRGKRGNWLARDLIAHKRAGSTVIVLTGPPASDAIERRLRSAGINVTRAFDRNCATGKKSSCNYSHLKLMTASFLRSGTRHYRVWTGSDNWSPNSLNSDDVAHRIDGEATYRQYVPFIDTIRRVY
jgi:phosphatidylserine/phosphatidylglycerophosphate/cardiolipin synthase-like enzyme